MSLSDDALKNYNPSSKFKTIMASFADGSKLKSVPLPEIITPETALESLLSPETGAVNYDADNMTKSFVNNVSASFQNTGKIAINIDKKDIKGEGPKGSKIKKLIQLILNIIKIPKRFAYLFKSLGEATGAATLGMGGIVQSVALGVKDVYLLIFAILNIVFKYMLCIISFIITTIAGCSLLHVITFTFIMVKVAIMYMVDFIDYHFKVDFTDKVDMVFEYIKWPEPINTICYSCFGKKVRLRDIITDVGVIEGIGNTISYDFNVRMPRYMKPGVPLGKRALKSLGKAMK